MEIKNLIKSLRKEQDILWRKYKDHNIHITLSLEDINGKIIEVVPHAFDLRSGKQFGRDLLDGKFKTGIFWE